MATEAYPGCRFYVLFEGQAQGVFTEVSGLQVEMDVLEYQEGGNNGFVYRLPGFTKVSNLTLKRGLTTSNEFYRWLADVASGRLKRRHISVVMYDVAGKELMRWNFLNAYPVKWVGPQLRAPDNTAAIETLELAHEGVTLG
ncbi:phage tail protein [Thermogemmatispora tikiterensis]|uniref:Phage tail protein n=1 Tax=Thermogemmatispora tikiterensis TaxID=1825093 RepID=A0A328VK87_9CHLR|nr:phage tail protein [Thermogemmatispora tikiterensis]RAQ97519.1 phage tail protein [Thermogemmatispora tikiterensis]